MHNRTNEQTNEQTNSPTNEPANEQTIEQTIERTNKQYNYLIHSRCLEERRELEGASSSEDPDEGDVCRTYKRSTGNVIRAEQKV